jgi:hypothetical protein
VGLTKREFAETEGSRTSIGIPDKVLSSNNDTARERFRARSESCGTSTSKFGIRSTSTTSSSSGDGIVGERSAVGTTSALERLEVVGECLAEWAASSGAILWRSVLYPETWLETGAWLAHTS